MQIKRTTRHSLLDYDFISMQLCLSYWILVLFVSVAVALMQLWYTMTVLFLVILLDGGARNI
jgi:hypothetical protein